MFKGYENHPDVEVVQNPPEWKYVEHLLGPTTIPIPTVKAEYPSGWCPPDPARYKDLPYYVARSRNFMYPVYLVITFRGQRRCTVVRQIEGDIWKLEAELHKMIEKRVGKKIYSQVNEMNRKIVFKGDYVTLVTKFFREQGL